MYLGDRASVAEAVRGFLGIDRAPIVPESILTTVLFTDIVGSTEKVAELGDAGWKELLARHDERAKREIERHRGRYVDIDGRRVARDVRRTRSRRDDAPRRSAKRYGRSGFEIRAGCHTGEVELAGDAVSGIAVHIGADRLPLAEHFRDPRLLTP